MNKLWILIGCILVSLSSCSQNKEEEHLPPALKSSIPENNASEVSIQSDVVVVFDEVIALSENHGITVNNEVAQVTTNFTKLVFTLELEGNSTYQIHIPKGAVINTFNVPLASDINLSFSTKEVFTPDKTGLQFVANMGAGWNLGNSLDTESTDPTAWGNPLATKTLIDSIAAKGFKTLRIPVTWRFHMGPSPEFTIEEAWLTQVEEVVNFALDNNMYAIINVHHDEEWLKPTYAELENASQQLSKVWTQIANHFKNYDSQLIFETLNEPRLEGSAQEWSGGTKEGRDCVNQFHAAAVSAIRNTGGNNADRYLMISPYAASSIQLTIDDLVLPTSQNLIVSVHNYFPYPFALAQENFATQWGSDAEKEALDKELDRVVEKFIQNGIPVVLGEWGSLHHNNVSERVKHAAYFARGCIERGICPVWWDNGNAQEFGLINRSSNQWIYPEIPKAIIESAP